MRTRILLLAAITSSAVIAIPAAASAATVVNDPPQVVGNGTPASCTSAAVVAAVAAGGTITFSCGPNPVTIAMTQTAKVVNTSAQVVIDGGGKVTLSGGGTNRILYMDTCDSAQIWTSAHCESQTTPQLVVKNLTLENGNSTGDGATGGGAIYAFGGALQIENSTFLDNECGAATGSAVGGGAVDALWQDTAQPAEISNSTFEGNVCDNPDVGGGGGAVFESQGNLDVESSSFSDNTCASTGPDVGGGAIRVFMGQATVPVIVNNSSFTNNSCSNGAALSSIDASWNVTDSTFLDNHAIGIGANPAAAGTPGGGSGGAIYQDDRSNSLAITGSLFESNTAVEGGGAIFNVSENSAGTLSIASSQLYANANAGFQRGNLPGIYFLSGPQPTVTGSVITAAAAPSSVVGVGSSGTVGAPQVAATTSLAGSAGSSTLAPITTEASGTVSGKPTAGTSGVGSPAPVSAPSGKKNATSTTHSTAAVKRANARTGHSVPLGRENRARHHHRPRHHRRHRRAR